MDEKLSAALKHLRLPGLLSHFDDYVKLAQKGNYSHQRLLQHILLEEHKLKLEHDRNLRLQRAQLPEHLVLETYPFHRQPKLNRKHITALYDSFEYIQKQRNIVWVGPTGVGKTGLASAFLIQAIERGYRGRHVLFCDLVTELHQAGADNTRKKVFQRYQSYDCLLIDEVGYAEVEPSQATLFFTLMHKRHKKKANLITSNLGFGDWRRFLKNEQLTLALIDRLTENSHVINMRDCQSLRDKLER